MYRRLQAYDREIGFPFTYNRLKEDVPDYSDGLCPNVEALFEHDLLLHFYVRHPLTLADMDDIVTAMEKVIDGREALLDARRKLSGCAS